MSGGRGKSERVRVRVEEVGRLRGFRCSESERGEGMQAERVQAERVQKTVYICVGTCSIYV